MIRLEEIDDDPIPLVKSGDISKTVSLFDVNGKALINVAIVDHLNELGERIA